MDRAAPGDGQHPVFLLVIQVAMKDYVAPDYVQHDVFLFLALVKGKGEVGGQVLRQAAKERGIGYATLKRLLDAQASGKTD